MSDDEEAESGKPGAGENKINICEINEMITCKVKGAADMDRPMVDSS